MPNLINTSFDPTLIIPSPLENLLSGFQIGRPWNLVPAIEALPNSARFAYIWKLRFSSAFTNEKQQVKHILFVKFCEIKPLNVGIELVQPSFRLFTFYVQFYKNQNFICCSI